MPRYDVQHVVALTSAQKKEFAEAITKLHSEAFKAPRLFINVIYTDISERTAYIGGKERKGNHILAHVRLGHRGMEDFRKLCREITAAWEQIMLHPHASEGSTSANPWTLASLIMMPLNLVGLEAVNKNYDEFQRQANNGDGKMIDLVAEIKERDLFE